MEEMSLRRDKEKRRKKTKWPNSPEEKVNQQGVQKNGSYGVKLRSGLREQPKGGGNHSKTTAV